MQSSVVKFSMAAAIMIVAVVVYLYMSGAFQKRPGAGVTENLVCPKCQYKGSVAMTDVTTKGNFSMQEGWSYPCPKCGALAKVAVAATRGAGVYKVGKFRQGHRKGENVLPDRGNRVERPFT